MNNEPDFTKPTASCSSQVVKQETDFQPGGPSGDGFECGGPSTSTPPVLDPRCRSGIPELAALWPVYVSNFRCPKAAARGEAIRAYFAEKGLTVRWWFNQMDDYYYSFQVEAGLFDMLVYFGSEADARRAIQTCHRQYYLGYMVNVLSGRDPEYFPRDRSLYAQNMKSGRVFSEEFFERRLRRWGTVLYSVKFDVFSGAVQMLTPQDARKAQASEPLWTLEPVVADIPKQRYLECEVIESIEKFLARRLHTLKPVPAFQFQPAASIDSSMDQSLTTSSPANAKNQPTGGNNNNNSNNVEVRPIRRGPTKKRQMAMLEQKKKKLRKEIEKALDRGDEPRCFEKRKEAKARFRRLVEEVREERRLGGSQY